MFIRGLWHVAAFAILQTALYAGGQTCRQTEVYPKDAASTAAPLRILAFGTSLMWGNGLRPAETLRHQVADSIARQTGRQVELVTYAHSGALLTSASQPGSIPVNPALDVGAINESLPTVDDQAACAVADRLTGASLILVEGCINDVGAERIVYPWTLGADIRHDTDTWCGHMSDTLRFIDRSFPDARVIVVGYYPIVSHETPFLGWFTVPRLIKHASKVYEGTDTRARKAPKQKMSRGQSHESAADHSQLFYERSKAALQNAVNERNAPGGDRFTYAGLPEITEGDGTITVDPDFAFGASKRKQWLIPIHLLPFWVIFKDHAYWSRQKLCRQYVPGRGIDELVCRSNAAAHPNVAGEALYAASILRAISPAALAAWRSAATQPSMTPSVQ